MNLILNLIVIAATVLGSGMALPQALKLVRTRSVDGVSAAWIGVSMAINTWWSAYAITQSVWALLPVSMVSLVLYLGMAVVFLRTVGRPSLPGFALGGLVLGMAPMPVLLVAGWEAAGLAIGLSYGLQLAPAVVATYRSRDLSGVSAGTWMIALVEALLWLTYGLMISDRALMAGGGVGSVMSIAILTRLAAVGSVSDLIRVDPVTRVKVARN